MATVGRVERRRWAVLGDEAGQRLTEADAKAVSRVHPGSVIARVIENPHGRMVLDIAPTPDVVALQLIAGTPERDGDFVVLLEHRRPTAG